MKKASKGRWVDSYHCRSRAHCARCRDPERTADREKWAERFDLPGGVVDFECPFGAPWRTHDRRPERAPETGDIAARRRACGECSGEVKEACFIAHQSACSQRRILANPAKECPAGLWSP